MSTVSTASSITESRYDWAGLLQLWRELDIPEGLPPPEPFSVAVHTSGFG